ncbi:hypothetical protein A6770_14280 [Nostoc minutum NIES-26]|uniref:SPOR domain-containing protein n=1 Tax=Nostoc minutum NIES-26 TaxID=1844469 RepID=A0A367RN06_9NOSO|nr:hypothetical protein [Dendronalium sp. ChiSLP03b]MDZ8204949.1 hypothetical protein [Dendronalium sp. ChiSLP03b]RCJ37947.1 hypothetical protein A6770_14280 [Nostoc minutum NIES-26]
MYSQISGEFIAYRMIFLFLGGWLALTSHINPAQAQINNSKVLLTQQGVVNTLPPPEISPIPFGQSPLPQVQPGQYGQYQPTQSVEFNQYQPNLQPTQSVEFNQYSQSFQRYLVYVDNYNYQTLQQVRQIEPGAYIRQYQGRSVIQSGVFNRLSNAQERVRQLESYRIYGAQIVSFTDGREIPTSSYSSNTGDRGVGVSRGESSRYYVAIPAKSEELPAIAERIRQNTRLSGFIFQRQSPRGPHVAVGPFAQRTEAEEWNNRLQNLGFGDARVYYGK